MFCDWMNAFKMMSLSLDLFGQVMMAHLDKFRSMCDHSTYLCNLVICGCICWISSVMIARSSAYVVVVHMEAEVLKWYPKSIFLSHLRRGSKKMMNRYGLRISAWIVPRLMFIENILPK